jgi:hypothetical protein
MGAKFRLLGMLVALLLTVADATAVAGANKPSPHGCKPARSARCLRLACGQEPSDRDLGRARLAR